MLPVKMSVDISRDSLFSYITDEHKAQKRAYYKYIIELEITNYNFYNAFFCEQSGRCEA